MADLVSLTFKLTEEQAAAICRKAGELDISRSELLRQGADFWLAILKEHPSLIGCDRERLTKMARRVGKIVAILEND